jgi:hypothetical protein
VAPWQPRASAGLRTARGTDCGRAGEPRLGPEPGGVQYLPDSRLPPGSCPPRRVRRCPASPFYSGLEDMRRRLTGLARMAIPARSQPGRGRSRAATRQCRGSGSLAMAVKAQVTAAPVPCPRPGSPGVGGAGRPGIASFRPPVAGAPPRLAPGDRQVPGPASHSARTQSRASAGTRCAPAEAPWSPSTGRHAARGLIRPGKTGRSLAPSPAHSPPGMLTHACR